MTTIRRIEFGNPGDAIQRRETLVTRAIEPTQKITVSQLQHLVEIADSIVSITYIYIPGGE